MRCLFSRFLLRMSVAAALVACPTILFAQFDPVEFDSTATGPWSDVALTTVVVPQVLDAGVTLDGKPSPAEYGGFEGVTVNPGENAWLLDWPGDRQWDSEDDSSFTFYLAHDTDFFYVGVDVKDDVVVSDDPNGAFWRDDAIEIVTDVWNDNYDNNTDNSQDAYGGHSYINYEGRFSSWNEESESIDGARWSAAVDDWTYGEEGDIFGFGEATDTGWNMEVRFNKRLFEDEEAGIELVEGTKMGFNIGMDDDDGFGTGPDGDGTRTQDLELQYFWANRERFIGWNQDVDDGFFEDEEIAASFEALGNGTADDDEFLALDHEWGINPGGRLSHGGAGEIVFGGLAEVPVEPTCDATTGGDFDKNGKVEFADFLILSNNFSKDVTGHEAGDVDCNGKVEFADFLVLSNNFGTSTGAEASSVPEPSGMLLGLLSLLGVTLLRKKQRS